MICHLVNASQDSGPLERGANFMLSVVKGIKPRDQVEAMLAAQMVAVHMASMTSPAAIRCDRAARIGLSC
jgi:hypothetical protein